MRKCWCCGYLSNCVQVRVGLISIYLVELDSAGSLATAEGGVYLPQWLQRKYSGVSLLDWTAHYSKIQNVRPAADECSMYQIAAATPVQR